MSAFNLGGVKDPAGNSLNLTGAPTNPPGTLAIDTTDTTAPRVTNVTTAPSTSHAGTISLTLSENVVVSGAPSLLLDNGRTATYQGGSGSSTLTFAYSSYYSQNGSAPRVAGIVLPSSSSIMDAAGNSANMSAAGATTSGRGSFSITGATELELFGPSTERVSFASGAQGELRLDASSVFTGRVSGFTGQDTIDLGDIAFGGNTTLAYQANSRNTGGTMTVSDGTHTARIALLGQYAASSFVMSANVLVAPSFMTSVLFSTQPRP